MVVELRGSDSGGWWWDSEADETWGTVVETWGTDGT